MTDLTKDEASIEQLKREICSMQPVSSQLDKLIALCRAPLVAEVGRLEQWHAEMADNRNAIASERDTLKAELERSQQLNAANAKLFLEDLAKVEQERDAIYDLMNSKRKYMEELRGALVYHMEQTRPIQRSIDALAIDAAIVKEQS